MNGFFQGMAGGIAGNEAQRMIDRNAGRPDPTSLFEKIHTTICELLCAIRVVSAHYEHADEPPLDQVLTLQASKRTSLSKRGRKYSMLFVHNNSMQLSVHVQGVGTYQVVPPAGWSSFDYPEGTEVSLTSGNDQNILYRVSNQPLAVNVI